MTFISFERVFNRRERKDRVGSDAIMFFLTRRRRAEEVQSVFYRKDAKIQRRKVFFLTQSRKEHTEVLDNGQCLIRRLSACLSARQRVEGKVFNPLSAIRNPSFGSRIFFFLFRF